MRTKVCGLVFNDGKDEVQVSFDGTVEVAVNHAGVNEYTPDGVLLELVRFAFKQMSSEA